MKNRGVVLISVLIVLTLIVSIILFGMEVSELESRISFNQFCEMQTHTSSWSIVRAIRNNLNQTMMHSCVIHHLSVSELSNKSKSWWNSSQTCKGQWDHFYYRYVVEPIKVDQKDDARITVYLLKKGYASTSYLYQFILQFGFENSKNTGLSWVQLR